MAALPITLCRPRSLHRPPAGKRLKQTEGVTFEAGENGTTIIRGWGKSGHAAMPQGTVNAIGLIVTCLLESKVCPPAETTYLQVLHTLHATTDGSAWALPPATMCLTR